MTISKNTFFSSIIILIGILSIVALSFELKRVVMENDEVDQAMCMHDVVMRLNAKKKVNERLDQDLVLAEVKKQCDVEIDTN